ncbi:type IV pilus modification PilV family protein [Dehalobacterium formicoaceticum]|uniref:type IV pilus modification PilV family protein n=1 Tax=Dehalobacterium formicoaceticum TaxID=51515 RepID=UPI0031F60BB5
MIRENRCDAGFTFVEVIVAMVIIMIGVIPLLGLFNSSLGNYERSTKSTIALHIAEQEIEGLGEEDLSTHIETLDWTEVAGSKGYECKNKITDVSYAVNGEQVQFYRVEVWVKWGSLGQEHEVFLRNYTAGK